jgi:parvulin-like peptidyl-prolyl isomerase
MNKDSKIMKFIIRNAVLISSLLIILVLISLILNGLIVYNEETQVATLMFANYEINISPQLYSTIQILSALPLASVIVVSVSILGLYVKVNVENKKSKRDLDKFMLISANKYAIDLYIDKIIIDNSFSISEIEKANKKQEINNIISEINAFKLETEDTANLSDEELLAVKQETLNQYNRLKNYFESIGDTIQLKRILPAISAIALEVEELLKKTGVSE